MSSDKLFAVPKFGKEGQPKVVKPEGYSAAAQAVGFGVDDVTIEVQGVDLPYATAKALLQQQEKTVS